MLHVVWAGFFGGVQTQLAALVRGFEGRPGVRHRICFLEGSGEVADLLIEEGLAFRLGFRSGAGPRALFRYATALRRVRPSVIHFHSPAIGAIIVSVVFSRGICVFSQHNAAAFRRTRRRRVLYAVLRRRFTRFVVPTKALEPLLTGYGIDGARITVLPYPLTIEPMRPPSDARGARRPTLGIVARLEPVKRVDLFVDVVRHLRERGIDCCGVVVGDGSRLGELMDQVAAYGLKDCIEFVGATTAVGDQLDRMTVLLLTSEADVYPLVALEAMARGVPLVAMPCEGGLPDLALRGGLLLRDRNPHHAAAALAAVLESPQAIDDLRARGTAVAAGHALENVLPVYDEFYRALHHA